LPKISVPIRKAANRFLRTDGTIDFAAVRSSIEWLLDRMTETWARLNGRSSEQRTSQVSRDKRLVLDSDTIKETKRKIEMLEKELQETSREREMIFRKEDALGKLKKLREIRALDEKVRSLWRISQRLCGILGG
jgi:predicted RNase H-like nuclease (RuvC/YqgF family)